MKDRIIKCQDCEQEFPWTVGEQEFFKEKGLEEPTRCMICRATKKAAKEDGYRGAVKHVL